MFVYQDGPVIRLIPITLTHNQSLDPFPLSKNMLLISAQNGQCWVTTMLKSWHAIMT